MIATLFNVFTILLGAFSGLLLRGKIGKTMEAAIYAGAGVLTLALGVRMTLKTDHILLIALSLVSGGIAGTALRIEDAVESLGTRIKSLSPGKKDDDGTFGKGFLDASVLFCSGAMALVGSFQAGTSGNYDLILTKSVLDGFLACILATTLGPGVALSSLAVLAYQGSLTLLASSIQPYVTETLLNEVTASGGMLLVMIGINLLGLKTIPTGNFLPAIVFAAALVFAIPFIPVL